MLQRAVRKCAPPFFVGAAGMRITAASGRRSEMSEWPRSNFQAFAVRQRRNLGRRNRAIGLYGGFTRGVIGRGIPYTHTLRIYTPQKPRKVCRPQAAKNSNHFSLRHVCRGKIPLRQPVWDFAATRQNYACSRPQTPLAEKSAGIFASKKRDARERLFFAVSM